MLLAKKVNISLLTWIKISLFVFFYDKLFFKNSFSSWFIIISFCYESRYSTGDMSMVVGRFKKVEEKNGSVT